MVRISVDVVNNAYQCINPVKQREISLRNLQIPTIENLGVTKDQFDVIDLSDNNIRKLDNLPFLKRLETILLHNNRVQQIDKKIGDQLPNLKTLALTNNNVSEFGDIDPLSKCSKLEYLTLIGNPLTHKQHYRQYVIYKLKSVRVLDFRRVKLMERKAAKKLFKGTGGESLRRQIVKESAPLLDEQEQSLLAAEKIKARSVGEQEKIKELIKNAKTLSEVENLQNILQSGRIPGSGLNAAEKAANGNGGMEEEMDDDDEEENFTENNFATKESENNVQAAEESQNGNVGVADAQPVGGMEVEEEEQDEIEM